MLDVARLLRWFVCSLLAGVALAQDDAAATRAILAQAIREWCAEYEAGHVGPHGPLRFEVGLQPRYAVTARAAKLFGDRETEGLTHLDALQKMLLFAERDFDEPLADAVLALAAVGFDKSLVDRDAVLLRDAGHWSLMRTDDQRVWFLVMRAASGDRVPVASADDDGTGDVARRVAALKLLGAKAWPVFRGAVEGGLGDLDPRVRLAAVEAIAAQRRPQSLSVLVRTMGVERHPIVSQALVRAVRELVVGRAAALADEDRERAVRAAMRQFGLCGWRTDMDLIDFVEACPHASAVEPLIAVLERAPKGDELEAAINQRASPLLRQRAHECLYRLTGAMFPIDQPAKWREFWEHEKHAIRIPEQLGHQRVAGGTASSFYGIPVTGHEIAFVIDTSGSMNDAYNGTSTARHGRRDRSQPSRLQAAKEQLLSAVQVMPPESRYHLLTFADGVQQWNQRAVPPTAAATRSLTDLLARIKAEGGTNVYEGLVTALQLDQLHFGQEAQNSIDELFLLSDGEPTTGRIKDPDQILALVRDANRYLHVRINTVFTGSGRGADFLRRLAEENDGVFVQR